MTNIDPMSRTERVLIGVALIGIGMQVAAVIAMIIMVATGHHLR